MRLHLGSGSVYLVDWINVDIPAPKTFLASERPDLVQKWKTSEDNYYGRQVNVTIDTLRKGPLDQEYVCDRFGSFHFLPVRDGEVSEAIARQAFEHLSIREAHQALAALSEKMKRGSILRLDVPDHEATLRLFMETGDRFYVRHLLGPRRNDHGFHMMSYTRDRLTSLVESHGFKFLEEEPDIHLYPSICLRFQKA